MNLETITPSIAGARMALKAKKQKKPKPPPWSAERAMAELGPKSAATDKVAWQRSHDAIMARDREEQDLARRQKRNAVAKKMPDEYRPVAGFQEQHSPTEDFIVRGDVRVSPDGKVKLEMIGQTRRRRAAAIIFGLLDQQQQQACQEIEVALELIPGVGRIRGQTFERQSRTTAGGPEAEAMVKLQLAYFGWARNLQSLGISHAAAFDIVFEGKTLSEVDSERRKRSGFAKQHLVAALDMWTIERGWRRTPTPAIQAFADKVRIARTVYEAMQMMEDDMEQGRAPGADGGRTLEMVKALPDTGSVVIVFTKGHAVLVEDMIAGIRGKKLRQRTKVQDVPDRGVATAVLTGLNVPVFVDPSFWDAAPIPLAAEVAKLGWGVNIHVRNDAQAAAFAHAMRLGQWDDVVGKVKRVYAECCRHGRANAERTADVARLRELPIRLEPGPGGERALMRQICTVLIPPGWRYGFAETMSGPPQPVLLASEAP